MSAFPIQVLNLDSADFNTHKAVADRLNAIQDSFRFVMPPDRYSTWGAGFALEFYKTDQVFERLRSYRSQTKCHVPFVIAVIHGRLASSSLANLFGSHEAAEGLAIVTTQDWNEHFAPPDLSIYLAYYFVRFTMSFISPAMKNHEETRSCFFDRKIQKADIKLSMKTGRLCDSCASGFSAAVDGYCFQSLLKLVRYVRDLANGSASIMSRPKVFIGSSTEGLAVAEGIQANLDHSADCTVWSQGVFGLSEGTLETLVKVVREYDYAVLVLTPDDVTTKRAKIGNTARDNVLFELGLFMGALGRDHTFIVHPGDAELELPSDLAGITKATFRHQTSGNLQAALGAACTQLKRAMHIT